jgi:predicted dehydrogenase
MQDVRIAIIGNSFASKIQLPALRWAGGNEVIGIAGKDHVKAQKTADEWDIPFATGKWRELLELEADLFIITTPVNLHKDMVLAVYEKTKAAILCEKPFAMDRSEATAIANTADERLFLIDHQLRWSPWRRAVRERLAAGVIGDPWHGRVEMLIGSPERVTHPYTWWYDANRGGGILGAIGSHMIDALGHEWSTVEGVRAALETYVPRRADANGKLHDVSADEHAHLWMTLENGAFVSLETSIMSPSSRFSFCEYVGSQGSLRLENEEELTFTPHGGEPQPIEVTETVPTFEELGMPPAGIFARMLPLYLRDVVTAVRNGDNELPGAADLDSAYWTQAVIDAARESHDQGAWVSCD